MSVSSLGGILRRLRRDIAERATFRNGTVVEMIDATHVLVDIGKPVPAFCSPIFLPAVVVGTPVTVRIQGSHYDVVDAPLSAARLVTGAEMASILARLTALEPAPAGNLIVNPLPAWSVAEWNAYGWPQPPASHFGWSTIPAETDPCWSIIALQQYGPTGIYSYSLMLEADTAPSTFRVYPHPADTASDDYSVEVIAGATYELSTHVAADNFTTTTDTVALGVEWLTDALVEVSTTMQTPAALNAVEESWSWTEQVETDPYVEVATGLEATAHPLTTFTAPTGATRARVFVEFGISAGWAYYVGSWDFHRAA